MMIRTTRVEDTFELGWGESYKSSPLGRWKPQAGTRDRLTYTEALKGCTVTHKGQNTRDETHEQP
ncbi:hypothetical protein COMA1_11777 [Candidatus Nitrospira nitrosa]|uniref:Uncharacterized protein n=1 Tax=Candidatus Nitrospira nitrosa TaxID=1742972 RepID=A0A0S4LDB3_9BACT|nr:hypothetical protein COMA1_11777 [Candidatus Nitrospira nitrosa]